MSQIDPDLRPYYRAGAFLGSRERAAYKRFVRRELRARRRRLIRRRYRALVATAACALLLVSVSAGMVGYGLGLAADVQDTTTAYDRAHESRVLLDYTLDTCEGALGVVEQTGADLLEIIGREPWRVEP